MPRSEALVRDILAHVYRIQEAAVATQRLVLDDSVRSAKWQRQGRCESTKAHPIRYEPCADVLEPIEAAKLDACGKLFDAQTPAEVYKIWEDFQRAIAELTLPNDPSTPDPRP